MSIKPIKPGPGQESVWDYPRPPLLQPVSRHIRIEHQGHLIADTNRAYRVLETSHPPVYYLPPEDLKMEWLQRVPAKQSFCEWKGMAHYYRLVLPNGTTIEDLAWAYETPTPAFNNIRNYLAFYAQKLDACYVGDEQVTPQPGGFYGGWVTSDVVGPFKGVPGSWGW
ncbi:MAG: DUF427 domain-containing protein [Bacteroidota bacterium]